MIDPVEQVCGALDAMGISYDRYTHPPVFTSDEAAEHWADIPATRVKNSSCATKRATGTIW